MHTIGWLLNEIIDIYILIIVIQVIVSWLIIFDVINLSNRQAQNLVALLKKCTDPVYKPIKKYVPPIGGIDITPLIVIIGLSLIQRAVIFPLFYRYWY